MKTILVTGATGLVGREIIRQILKSGNNAYASSRNKNVVCDVPVISTQELLEGEFPHIDIIINCAFSRSNQPSELCSALDFTKSLINVLRKMDIGVINVSSQGVYKRLPVGQLSTEDSPIEPSDMYSLTKYATEQMFEVSDIRHFTNVRLSSINMKQRFLARFVECVKENKPIRVNSPRLYASLMDVQDAATGLLSLAMMHPSDWKNIYNLGIGKQYSLLEYAEQVKAIAQELGYTPTIEVEDNGICSTAGMDISRINIDTQWQPLVSNDIMIKHSF